MWTFIPAYLYRLCRCHVTRTTEGCRPRLSGQRPHKLSVSQLHGISNSARTRRPSAACPGSRVFLASLRWAQV